MTNDLKPPLTEQPCPHCGAVTQAEQTHCPWCKTELAATSPTPVPPNVTEPPRLGPPAPDAAATVRIVYEPLEEDDPLRRQPAGAAPYAPGQSGRGWLPTGARALVAGLALMLLCGAIGAFQGLQDRKNENRREAVASFQKGQQLMVEGRYELARANFREALRREPNFQAAAQLMTVAEQQAAVALAGDAAVEPPPLPTLTPLPAVSPTVINDHERLFQDGQTALAREDWGRAATAFDALRAQAPTFRPDEVAEGLFQAWLASGQTAAQRGQLDDAILQLDQALTLRPNDPEALALRRLSTSYRNGLAAYRQRQWERAADQFRTVYLIDPDFLETTRLLAQSHLELGRQFQARSIPCQAAQQFRASASVVADAQVAELARTNDRLCSTRATASPRPRATATRPPTVATLTPPTAPTAPPLEPTETVQTPGPIPSLAIPTIVAIATLPPPPLPTATAAPPGGFVPVTVENILDPSCGGHYIRGRVLSAEGEALPGWTLLLVDQYGNRFTALSKQDPPGVYDFPIPAQPIQYQLMVLSGDTVVSQVAYITHSDQFAQAPQACHSVIWRQSGG